MTTELWDEDAWIAEDARLLELAIESKDWEQIGLIVGSFCHEGLQIGPTGLNGALEAYICSYSAEAVEGANGPTYYEDLTGADVAALPDHLKGAVLEVAKEVLRRLKGGSGGC